jgi:hypothetical protein
VWGRRLSAWWVHGLRSVGHLTARVNVAGPDQLPIRREHGDRDVSEPDEHTVNAGWNVVRDGAVVWRDEVGQSVQMIPLGVQLRRRGWPGLRWPGAQQPARGLFDLAGPGSHRTRNFASLSSNRRVRVNEGSGGAYPATRQKTCEAISLRRHCPVQVLEVATSGAFQPPSASQPSPITNPYPAVRTGRAPSLVSQA